MVTSRISDGFEFSVFSGQTANFRTLSPTLPALAARE